MNKYAKSKDCWMLDEGEVHSPWYGRTFRFDFSNIRSVTLREQVKYYIWKNYRSGDKVLATLRQEMSWFRYYEVWLWERGVDSLEQIREADAEGFLTYLHTCISKKTGRTLRLITQKHIYDTVRGLYRWYAMRDNAFADALGLFPGDVYQRINRVVRTERMEAEKKDGFLQALSRTQNPCLRYGGRILAVTGIAPSDLLGLETDCLKSGKNGVSMRYYHHRSRVYRMMPVNRECTQAVENLKVQTDALRQLAPEEAKCRLFLHYSKWEQVIVPDADLFRYWLRQLMERETAEEAPTLTQLRYGCVQDMLRFLPPAVVGEVTGSSWPYAVRAAGGAFQETEDGACISVKRRCGT